MSQSQTNEFRPIIGIPMERTISYADTVVPWLLGLAQQGWPFIQQGYTRTDVARNRFAQHLLQDDRFTHLVMLDLDHDHPVGIVHQFGRMLAVRPDIKILSGLAYRRSKPYEPLMYVKDDEGAYYKLREWDRGAIISVDAVGTPCICIAREVFETLEFPWFTYDYSDAHNDMWITEDIVFCEAARAAGFKIYVDTRMVSPHLTIAKVDGVVFDNYCQEFGLDENTIEIEEAG